MHRSTYGQRRHAVAAAAIAAVAFFAACAPKPAESARPAGNGWHCVSSSRFASVNRFVCHREEAECQKTRDLFEKKKLSVEDVGACVPSDEAYCLTYSAGGRIELSCDRFEDMCEGKRGGIKSMPFVHDVSSCARWE